LDASLLDAGATFNRLVERYSEDQAARDRILGNRYYNHLSGGLSGILEYMAVERLFEVASGGSYGRIVLDTPPTREALEFLEAPDRIVDFLDSGALKIALRNWFDEDGHLKPTRRFGGLGRRLERYLDDFIGLELLKDMAEFFQAFAPLFAGFRSRAQQVRELLQSRETIFVLVTGPGEEEIPDLLFFARKLAEGGHRVGPIVINRVHPRFAPHERSGAGWTPDSGDGVQLLEWLGERDHAGVAALRALLQPGQALASLPLLSEAPTDLGGLSRLGDEMVRRLDASK
jgi:anion-transporting  ArsA/GET3 family ATPase